MTAAVNSLTEQRVKVPELSRAELRFYFANGFEIYRHWHYMERDAPHQTNGGELPNSYDWYRIDEDGLAKWVRCHNEAFGDHWDYKALTVDSVRDFIGGGDQRGLLGISHGDALVAISSYQMPTALPSRVGIIWSMGVVRAHRGKGLGKALATRAISHLMGRGTRRIGLFVDEENSVAYGLYRRLGFRPVERSLILRRFP